MSHLTEICHYRTAQAAAKTDMRLIEAAEKRERILAQERAYAAGAITGSNDAARRHQMDRALLEDAEYQVIYERLVRAQNGAEEVSAVLENLLDERREREWAIRDRLADAILAQTGLSPITVDAQGDIRVPLEAEMAGTGPGYDRGTS